MPAGMVFAVTLAFIRGRQSIRQSAIPLKIIYFIVLWLIVWLRRISIGHVREQKNRRIFNIMQIIPDPVLGKRSSYNLRYVT
jgi:hypothetical protein